MTDTAVPFRLDDLDPFIEELMRRDRVPGLTVGVLLGDDRMVAGHGIANQETGVPVTPDTVFQIGSITKVFTASLIMGLVDEGRLSIEQRVVDVLPDFRLGDEAATQALTLEHCLTHVCGFDGDRFDDHGDGEDALARCVSGYDTLRQQLPPGTTFSYCNTGWNILGRVIEVVTGQPYETALRERLLQPLGLDRPTCFADEAILLRAAAGHLNVPGSDTDVNVARPYPLARNINPAGGMIADVDSLLTFAAAFLDGADVPAPFPSPATREQMKTVHVPVGDHGGRGLGWAVDRAGDEVTFGHGGATNGFKASLLVVPGRRFAIATLTNSEDGLYTYRDIEREVLRRALGITVTDPEPIAPEPGLADRVTGTYRAMLAELVIAGSDDALTASVTSINPFTDERHEPVESGLVPVAVDALMVPDGVRKGTRVDLLPGDDGRVDMVRMGGRIAVRV
ncbi:MAG TPA: serine hydrolase domain-containing protein [Thermomicrobiales bacterium]|nr:serine hydrolase domain-containing protein [Thermomicrobiales bacterium]